MTGSRIAPGRILGFTTIYCLLLTASALAGDSPRAPVLTVGVIADMNGTSCKTGYPANSTQALASLMAGHELDHVVSTGDAVGGECLSYSGSVPYQTVVRKMWEEFDAKFVKPLHDTEGVSLVLSPGNHDAPSYTGRETFRAENAEFLRYWQNQRAALDVRPLQVPGVSDSYPYYWAYLKENVLFLVLRSTQVHTLASAVEQKRWLKAVLKSPEARGARARIAFGHVPAYAVLDPSVGNKFKEILTKEQVGQPDALVDILLDHGVDLLLSGHSHAPYPAELTRVSDKKRMKIVSMPCAHAPRKLYSKSAVAPRGFAVLEIFAAGEIRVSLHNHTDGNRMPASYFPASIPVPGGKVTYKRLGAPDFQ
jgi:hypothetical protein